MRVMFRYKWDDGNEGIGVSEIADVDILDDKSVALTNVNSDMQDFVTEKPIDKDTYERALRDLLKNGYVDLSGHDIIGYDFGVFVPVEDEDDEEESSNAEAENKDKEE